MAYHYDVRIILYVGIHEEPSGLELYPLYLGKLRSSTDGDRTDALGHGSDLTYSVCIRRRRSYGVKSHYISLKFLQGYGESSYIADLYVDLIRSQFIDSIGDGPRGSRYQRYQDDKREYADYYAEHGKEGSHLI